MPSAPPLHALLIHQLQVGEWVHNVRHERLRIHSVFRRTDNRGHAELIDRHGRVVWLDSFTARTFHREADCHGTD